MHYISLENWLFKPVLKCLKVKCQHGFEMFESESPATHDPPPPYPTPAVLGKCQACDIMQYTPVEFTIIKNMAMTVSRFPQQGCDGWKVVFPTILNRWQGDSGYKWLVNNTVLKQKVQYGMLYVWARSCENVFYAISKQQRCRSVWSAPLLFAA